MATTVALANQPTTPSDVAVKFFTQTDFKLRAQEILDNGRTLVATYVLTTGSAVDETLAVVRTSYDPKSDIYRNSLTVTTEQVVTVDSVVTEEANISVGLFWNTPGRMEDPGKVLDLIGSAYSLVFNGVTTKVPNTGTISAINRGLVGDLFG